MIERLKNLLAVLAHKYCYIYIVDPVSGKYSSYMGETTPSVSSILQRHDHGNDFYADTVEDIDIIVFPDDKKKALEAFSKERLLEIVVTKGTKECELRWCTENPGEIVWAKDTIAYFSDEGKDSIVIAIEDITDVKNQEEAVRRANEIERKSKIDPLTGVSNRLALTWAYNGDFKDASSIGVISCDLNGLKKVNDKDGHIAGDEFINSASKALVSVAGQQNVYRIGGDEFLVVLLSKSQSEFEELVDQLRDKCINDSIKVSIGYAFSPNMAVSFEHLLIEADRKMYEEKREYYKRIGIDRRNKSEMFRNEEFVDAMVDYGSLCYLAFKMNITKNTFEIIHIMEGYDTSFRDECETLEDVLRFPVKKGVMHHDDIGDYNKYSSLEFLSDFARRSHGQSDHWIRYRSKYNRPQYDIIELQFFFGREYTDDNQVGYFIIKDMGKPISEGRMLFTEALKGLSDGFNSVFYVDFENDEMKSYRVANSLDKNMLDYLMGSPKYEDAIKSYIDICVTRKDRELMRIVCQKEYIRQQFMTRKDFSHEFRVNKNGNDIYYRVKFANLGMPGEFKDCVIGFENINSEKQFGRSHENHVGKILIVEDAKLDREMLRNLLEKHYGVYEANDGQEALEILEKHYSDVELILADITMPNLDGYGLLEKIKSDRRLCDIPVVIITALDDESTRAKCLKLGASDFISKPYDEYIIRNSVDNQIKLREVTDVLSKIEIDSVTGLYTKEAFYTYAQNLLDMNYDRNYTFIVSDIAGFRTVNDQYGMDMGNRLLNYIAKVGMENRHGFTMGGRLGSDVMVCVLANFNVPEAQFSAFVNHVIEDAPVPNLDVKFGLIRADEYKDMTAMQLSDMAMLAIETIKGEYGKHYTYYDKAMADKLRVEHIILGGMDDAIKDEQFQIYYQPKFDAENKTIAGAEALVRWIHPELGFMNPGVFIPIFERNGFITRLDKYVWEKACKDISEWIKKGFDFPVSVNVSRRDFEEKELADYIIELVDSYSVPHSMFHIEVTESAYSDNPEVLKETINKLHESGFIIELDDFGAGYSSLTALNSMDIDVLKLDLSIIESDVIKKKDKSVLDFAMNLAKMMQVQTLQEGVETEEQFERVKDLGCTYVQGYYFSKPLGKSDFDKFLSDLQ